MRLKDSTHRFSLGKVALACWYGPIGRIRNSWSNGGPWVERGTEQARRQMEAAAETLPPLRVPAADSPLRVHLLTGSRFWYQTVFCVHSLAQAAGEAVGVDIYDDGTISRDVAKKLMRLGSAITIHSQGDTIRRLDRLLPSSRFPILRERWINYPNIRKLTDIHVGSSGWKLVIDSDLLFFRRPEFLLNWLTSPSRPLHAVDCEESYGYSRSLMERLTGATIPKLVNVGLCGLSSDALDWIELESWCAELIARERTSYYLEQAIVAMIVSRLKAAVAPARDYVTLPGRDEVTSPTTVMHHYVAQSKRWYFRKGWQHVCSPASA